MSPNVRACFIPVGTFLIAILLSIVSGAQGVAVSIAPTGISRFKVRLEKGGVVFLNLKDSSTGRPPDQEGLRATLQWTADERNYETLGTFSVKDPATYPQTGEMRSNAPPGILRIVVDHREGAYKPTSIPIRLAGAGTERVSISLVRN